MKLYANIVVVIIIHAAFSSIARTERKPPDYISVELILCTFINLNNKLYHVSRTIICVPASLESNAKSNGNGARLQLCVLRWVFFLLLCLLMN